jgi:fumarylacetoacetate (FAA) hydrolase
VKLGSLKAGGRDGTLIVVDRNLSRAVAVPEIAPSLRAAIERWDETERPLAEIAHRLETGAMAETFALDLDALGAPLPRAAQFLDGSGYLNHIELARRARGDSLPETLETEPLMYQGCSEPLLGAREPIRLENEDWGLDFEAETAAITDDVPMGVPAAAAGRHIKLLMLLNDISLRRLIPAELATGFGFVHGKPPSAFSPVALSPDELGPAWDDARLHGRIVSTLNGTRFGDPDTGVEMQFGFPALIAHAARTRPLGAGTIIGSGTVSNSDRTRGSSCILERRMIEKLENGKASSAFMAVGDRIRIEWHDSAGGSPFGAIDQTVAP